MINEAEILCSLFLLNTDTIHPRKTLTTQCTSKMDEGADTSGEDGEGNK